MTIRTFIFCDICNPQGLRSIEYRRTTRLDERSGRRISDGRAWLEASLDQSLDKSGWVRTADGLHLCPRCQTLHSSN
ncbi:hypothetical protein [Methylomonas sp. AM2-LC]|uniref:hypothetical protein n=1 Tax=Methylomonas sp. AM2-LC TaxID=3153301 RepID=UPI003265D67B